MVADPCETVEPDERQRDMAGQGPRAGVGRESGAGEPLRVMEDVAILVLQAVGLPSLEIAPVGFVDDVGSSSDSFCGGVNTRRKRSRGRGEVASTSGCFTICRGANRRRGSKQTVCRELRNGGRAVFRVLGCGKKCSGGEMVRRNGGRLCSGRVGLAFTPSGSLGFQKDQDDGQGRDAMVRLVVGETPTRANVAMGYPGSDPEKGCTADGGSPTRQRFY